MKSLSTPNIKLNELCAILFDCQATNANPHRGYILEMAWTQIIGNHSKSQINSGSVKNYLIELPDDALIPKHVARVTGITKEDSDLGVPVKFVWEELLNTTREVVKHHGSSLVPLIIHYSRYEEAFLKYLHSLFSPEALFPFKIVCTHQISRYLWPELPRRGLRAVAGFLGYSVGEMRRSMHHVEATAWIWKNLVQILEDQKGIKTIGELEDWLNKPMPSRLKKKYPMDKKKLRVIPDRPGIYRMLRSNGDLLYIGKAASLRQRVKSYFQNSSRHSEHILEMLSQAKDISTTETKTALEAALLEADQIKKHTPPYNIALKEGNRRICFSDIRFDHISNRYTGKCRLGPFPSRDLVHSMYSIVELNSGADIEKTNENMIVQSLMISKEFIPEDDCFYDGLKLFHNEVRDIFKGRLRYKQLITLGNILWQERLDQIEQELIEGGKTEEEDVTGKEEPVEWQWTPERVARHLKGVIRHGVHMIRRGEWLRQLSESVLIWTSKTGTGDNQYQIIISESRILDSRRMHQGTKIPLSPMYNASNSKRMENFDLPDYDRLRILTTEIRRLIKDNRNPELRWGPQTVLTPEALTAELKWV